MDETDLRVGPDGKARPSWAYGSELLQNYYDHEWGMPVRSEQGLYERICLEGYQCGLSWAIVLKKRAHLREAFDGFNPDSVATFDDEKLLALSENTNLIRNKAKLKATVTNAQATIALRGQGGLANLIWSFRPSCTPLPQCLADIPTQSEESRALARELKKKGFVFIGPTTAYALMESIGMVDTHLMGSHRRGSSRIWPE